uniref:Uncharacterized protein n=1 Tax=Chromera velia CCMP2878 TaxID=1169474 RepID=A0A0G4GV18_9ALVE|eukprot:Cvel_23498.t1-p1 / transcript=Cvel_23498.t1 / gene=Cvel_23498 / organism=Chromera_velia_CCMP2878 / gene_product=hypothetical protein / transcript_product=hypothetical protein / location=Cvel_scaffold2427:18954-23655(-) / protein_length=934 / sequence_SO=supercontig / SO=protein_coding / is_pseudo=false
MSRLVPRLDSSSTAEGHAQNRGAQLVQTTDSILCALFEHARPTAKEISKLASGRSGIGVAWLLLELIKTGRVRLPFESLDLSDFSLSAGKLKYLLTSAPSGPGFLETLKCGSHVCKDACLAKLLEFLLQLKREEGGRGGGTASTCLKTLNLASNRLRSVPMEALGCVFSLGWLPSLLSLDLSDNPLGRSGVRALARGLSSSPQSLPLQSLKLARTKAKAEGVQALAETLKAKKTTSLQTLDLEGNEMRPAGLKHLASAVNAEAVPHLRVLILKGNSLTQFPSGVTDKVPLSELLSTEGLKELEELDLGGNWLFNEFGGDVGSHSGASAAAIAAPGRFPKLRRLDLGGVFPSIMSSKQLVAFATALGVEGAPSLQELALPCGGSPENPEGVVALSNALSSGHLSQLTELKVAGQEELTEEAFATLCRSLTTGKASLLQTLNLEMFHENPGEGVGVLAEGIRGGGLSSLINLRLDLLGGLPRNEAAALSILGLALGGGGCPRLQDLALDWEEEGDVGVGGIAEGLGGGRLPSLQNVSLLVRCVDGEGGGEGEGGGCVALGEVLSTGKVPSLRSLTLTWDKSQGFRSLCEGLSRGRIDPPVMVDLSLWRGADDLGVTSLAQVIRAGKLSGLQKVCFQGLYRLSPAGGGMFGECLSHAEASLNSLEELDMNYQRRETVSAFLGGLLEGSGRLPALHSLQWSSDRAITPEDAQSLSALVNGGTFPFLRNLTLDLSGIGQQRFRALTAALSSPNVSALRRLDVRFRGMAPPNAAAEVGLFSAALTCGHLRRLEELCVRGLYVIEEVRALCEGLGSGRLSSLQKLGLSGIRLETDGGRALSEVLVAEKLPCLRRLDAFNALLSDEGLIALVDGWLSHPPAPLEELNLQFNRLTREVADALFTLLGSRQMPLQTVHLYGNFEISERERRLLSQGFPDICFNW